MTKQDKIFSDSEGDAWFSRNAEALLDRDKPDPVTQLLVQLHRSHLETVRSVCDVGCSNGWRLARLGSVMPATTRLCGFDASNAAVSAGTASFPGVELRHGLADSPPFSEKFDLVIASFVLHWVDRASLSRAIAAIDGLVADDGLLVIADFLPDRPCARRYHHRDDIELFTYKQDYIAAFTSLGLYDEVARLVFAHDEQGVRVGPTVDQQRAVCAVLHKHLGRYLAI